jgi:hypothetical protein
MGFSYFQNEIRLEILTNVYKIQILYYFIYVLIMQTIDNHCHSFYNY